MYKPRKNIFVPNPPPIFPLGKIRILFTWVNPLRASLVERQEEFRWNSIGFHVQTKNVDDFLSLDIPVEELKDTHTD